MLPQPKNSDGKLKPTGHLFTKRDRNPFLPNAKPDILEMTEVSKEDVSEVSTSIFPEDEFCDIEESFSGYSVFKDDTLSSDMENRPSPIHLDDPGDGYCLYQGDAEGDCDTILGQFETFFRRKIDLELSTLQSGMHAMLSEQQVHFRNILMTMQMNPERTLQDFQTPQSVPEAVSMPMEPEGSEERCLCKCPFNTAKFRLIIELFSLNCQLSALLGTAKFTE